MTELNKQAPSVVNPEYPVYFAGGTGYDQQRNEGVNHQIGNMLGRATVRALADPIHFDPDFRMVVAGGERQVTRKHAYGLAHTADVSLSISNFQAQRADELLGHLEQDDLSKVDAIFQSADALNGLIAANADPTRFNNIILAYPAGLVRPHDIKKVAPKVVMQEGLVRLKRKHRDAKKAESFEDGRRGKSKGTSTIVSSVGLSKQNQLLHELRAKEGAPGVAMVVGTDDIMLAPERVIASLQSPDDIDVVLVVDTPHGINGRKDILAEVTSLFTEIDAIRANNDRLSLTDRIRFAADVADERKQTILAAARVIDAKSSDLMNPRQDLK